MDIEQEVLACMEDMLEIVVKKEEQRLYHKQYREKNKEEIAQYKKQWREKNKEEIAEKHKQWRENNKERKYQQNKEWSQTYEGKKSQKISSWKYQGIITDDYDTLYEHYLKTSFCDACRVELTYDKKKTPTTKCVDHDHSITDRPNFRNILCNSCNVKRG